MRDLATRAVLGLAALLVCLLPAAAWGREEPRKGRPAKDSPAARVAAAFDGRDEQALATLARSIKPDRWEIADTLCRVGRHDAARAFATSVPEPEGPALLAYLRARGTGAPHAAVRAAWAAADAARGEEASQAAISALRELGSEGDAWERARTALTLGLLRQRLGPADEATAALNAAARQCEALGWMQGAAEGWLQAGLTAWSHYDARLTRKAWRAYLGVEKARRSPDGQSGALMNLGSLALLLGDATSAERNYAAALALLRGLEGAGVRAQRVDLLVNMAEAARRSGRIVRAQERIDEALGHFAADDRRPQQAIVLAAKSAILQDLNDLDGAQRLIVRAEEMVREDLRRAGEGSPAAKDLEYLLAKFQANRALLLHDHGLDAEAIPMLRLAADTFEARGAVGDQAQALDNLGVSYLATGRLAEAEAALERALALARKAGDRWHAVNAQQNLADARYRSGRTEAARELHDEALTTALEMSADRLIADGHAGLALCELALGKPKRALTASLRAANQQVRLLAGLASPRGPYARERDARTFEVALEAALALDDRASASWFIECGRAATLLSALQGREEMRDVIVPKGLLEDERTAERDVAEARSLMERAAGDFRAAKTSAQRDQAKLRYDRFKLELDTALADKRAATEAVLKTSLSAATLLYGRVDELDDVREHLEPGDVFVSYAATRTHVVALVVEPNKDRLVTIGTLAAVEQELAKVDYGDEHEAITKAQTERLRELLLAPLQLPAKTTRLLISPVGQLAFFPFAALLPGVQVAYEPSGTAYGMLRAGASPKGQGVLGIGGPDYTGRKGLPDLKGSAKEVGNVATRPLLGPKATETEFRSVLAEGLHWQALHFACHGKADPEHPLRSALALTRGTAPGDDGFLTALEVLRLSVRADLTVLSACETGQGRYFRGEGLVGLPRAFLTAGSPRVIASLWPVEDRATAALMSRFYELWRPKQAGKAGLPAAEALRRAQAEVRAQKGWEHPSYWAAWVLWGLPD